MATRLHCNLPTFPVVMSGLPRLHNIYICHMMALQFTCTSSCAIHVSLSISIYIYISTFLSLCVSLALSIYVYLYLSLSSFVVASSSISLTVSLYLSRSLPYPSISLALYLSIIQHQLYIYIYISTYFSGSVLLSNCSFLSRSISSSLLFCLHVATYLYLSPYHSLYIDLGLSL